MTRELSLVFDDNTLVLVRVKQDGVEMAVTPGELFGGLQVAEELRNSILSNDEVEQDEPEQEDEKEEGAPIVSSETPFGTMQSDEGLKRAPTKQEVSAEPGKYEGTAFDPLNIIVPEVVIPRFSTPVGISGKDDNGNDTYFFVGGVLADWFKIDAQAALGYYQNLQGFGLNLMGLSQNQMLRMGILPKEIKKS